MRESWIARALVKIESPDESSSTTPYIHHSHEKKDQEGEKEFIEGGGERIETKQRRLSRSDLSRATSPVSKERVVRNPVLSEEGEERDSKKYTLRPI